MISQRSLSDENSKLHSMLMDTVRDIERVGDHMENVMELVDYQMTNKVTMSEDAYQDMEEMFDLTIKTLQEAIRSLENDNMEEAHEGAREVIKLEEQIDKMERKLRKKHILRVNEGRCSGSAGIVFVDIISNLERIGDHSVNIAEAVLHERD